MKLFNDHIRKLKTTALLITSIALMHSTRAQNIVPVSNADPTYYGPTIGGQTHLDEQWPACEH
ncbi:MAG: hypothetical protein JSS82_12400 [Bacteroidetes bacterium]|nr:hypothetical protein [Bacteroidota bacterium]